MGWAKFDDRWATHPKLLGVGLEAAGLDARGICWCAGQETDGFVPDAAVLLLAAGHRSPKKLANLLVAAGRWKRDDERKGYMIHDYLDYNQSREAAEAKREDERNRKASYRKGQGRSPDGRITSTRTADVVPPGQTPDRQWDSARIPQGVPPVPTRPDPTPNKQSSSSHHGVAPEVAEEEELRERMTTAVRLVAERRLAVREGSPITNASAWLRSVQAEVVTDHGDELRTLAAQGLHPKVMAERIMPAVAPASPYPKPDEEPIVFEEEWVIQDGRNVLVARRRTA